MLIYRKFITLLFATCFLTADIVTAVPLLGRDETNTSTSLPSTNGTEFYQSVSAAAMVSLFAMHQYASKVGFVFSRHIFTTDVVIALTLSVILTCWTAVIIIGGFLGPGKICKTDRHQCLAYLAYCPWMLQILSASWFLHWLEFMYFAKARERVDHPRALDGPEVSEKYDLTEASDREYQAGFWKLRIHEERGPYDWAYSIGWKFYVPVFVCMTGIIGVTSVEAIRFQHYSTPFLNLAAFGLYVLSATGKQNPYGTAPHIFQEDMIRITCPPLSNSRYRGVRRAGLVYILPSRKHGFSAYWSVTVSGEETNLSQVGAMYEDLLLDRVKEIARWRKSFETIWIHLLTGSSSLQKSVCWSWPGGSSKITPLSQYCPRQRVRLREII